MFNSLSTIVDNFIAVVVIYAFILFYLSSMVCMVLRLSIIFLFGKRNSTSAGDARTFKAVSLTNMTRDSRNCGHLGMLNLFSCAKAPSPQN